MQQPTTSSRQTNISSPRENRSQTSTPIQLNSNLNSNSKENGIDSSTQRYIKHNITDSYLAPSFSNGYGGGQYTGGYGYNNTYGNGGYNGSYNTNVGYNMGYGGYRGIGVGGGYGGYGGGYGSSYGGGYGGGYGGSFPNHPNGMNDIGNGPLSLLHKFSQTVGMIGQITDILGMNAEALNFCFGTFVHFAERITFVLHSTLLLLAPPPVFPLGHPRHGEPYYNSEEEKKRMRRIRIVKMILSLLCAYLLSKGGKMLFSYIFKKRKYRYSTVEKIATKSLTSKINPNNNLDMVFNNAQEKT